MLMEVMIAMAILATAGVGYLALTSASMGAMSRAREKERSTTEANALLTAASLWSTIDLDRRLGRRRQGRWLLEIQRGSPLVYSITVRDSASGVEVLATSVYRRSNR